MGKWTYVSRTMLPGWVLLVFSAVVMARFLILGWSMPPLDAAGFRQTQTAITIEWMAKGHLALAYLTPVVGAPWSIPFEFPLYQWLAALLAWVSGLSVDNSARLVSALFHVGSVWMLQRMVLVVHADRVLALCIAAAYAASPFALFWGRAVMIESIAVFFGLTFIWAMAALHTRTGWHLGPVAVVSAVLAVLIKVTTFFGFAAFAVLALAWLVLRERGWRRDWIAAHRGLLLWGGASALVALLALLLWLGYADALKSRSLIGQALTSKMLGDWNYGTLRQRLDPETWLAIFRWRVTLVLGSRWLFVVLVIAGLWMRQIRAAVLLLLLAYIAPFLVFTNLHATHAYYQAANVVFATGIVGLVIWRCVLRMEAGGGRNWALALAGLLCLLAADQVVFYEDSILRSREPTPASEIARAIKQETSPESVVVAFGLDWSSELPYFAGRRAVMVPEWVGVATMRALARSDAMLGGSAVGALVVCPTVISRDPARATLQQQIVRTYAAGTTRRELMGCQVWLRSGPR